MPKVKIPFRKHQLPKRKVDAYTPPKTKIEGTDIRNRGYHPGSNYTPDELEWMAAVERLQKRTGRKFLSHVDYQRLALSLGYSKTPPTLTPLGDGK